MPKRMGCRSLVQMHIVMQSEVTRGNFHMKIDITPQTTNIKEIDIFKLNEYENLSIVEIDYQESKLFFKFKNKGQY